MLDGWSGWRADVDHAFGGSLSLGTPWYIHLIPGKDPWGRSSISLLFSRGTICRERESEND